MKTKKGNLVKRIFAGIMAFAMVMSNVTIANVYADEVVESEEFALWFNTDGSATGIKAGQQGEYPVYAGEDMAGKTNKITVDGVDHYSVQGANNPKANGNNPNGAIPTAGAYLKVVAPADGTITVYGYAASGKPFYATKGDTATISDGNAFCDDSHSYTVTVKEGEEWFFYAQGSKAQFVGVKFEHPKASVTIPVEFTGAELGDTIVNFTNVTTGDAVGVGANDATVTLTEGYKYSVAIDSAALVIDTDEVDLTNAIPEKILIHVETAAKHAVSGHFMGLPEGASVSSFVFTDVAGVDNKAIVNGNAYKIELKNGYYTASATVTGADGYTVFDHVAVAGTEGEAIANDVWFYGPAKAYSTEYKAELKVGKTEGCDYVTITEALAAVKAMSRTADEYVTLTLCDDEYVEQVIVDAANVKMVAAEGVEPTIRFYYGIGYKYYSIDSTGYYNEKNANDKYEMNYAQRWGATVRIKAAGFKAEGIEFVNTFNRYVCEEELGDSKVGNATEYGQSMSGSLQERVSGLDVANTTNVERAAAVAVDADNAEFTKCSFISSQDTLYTGSAHSYYNDCVIVGQTDYIFGNTGCKAIFDNCKLQWLGYTGSSKAGYITATRGDYLFRNCEITINEEEGYTVTPGYFGRPWGNTPSVKFVGTKIAANAITEAGWTDMSGVKPTDVEFAEYGNTVEGKNFYSTYASNDATKEKFQITKAEAEKLADPANDTEYLGSWDPDNKITTVLDLSTVADWNTVGAVDTPDEEEEKPETSATTQFLFEAKDLTAFAAGAKADGDEEKAGTENYFTLIYSAKSKVDSSSKTFDDEYASAQRVNFGGAVSTTKNAMKFTTSNKATVKVWWVEGGDDNRQMAILDASGKQVAVTDLTIAKNACAISTFDLEDAGTYYLGGATNNNYIFKVEVTESNGVVEKAPRADWSNVAGPIINDVKQNGANIDVSVSALVGYDGADKVTVELLNKDGQSIATKNSLAEKDTHVLAFAPAASGTYSVVAKAVREGEEDKVSEVLTVDYILPLAAPVLKSATSTGSGTAFVEWNAVAEAEKYIVSVNDEEVASVETTELSATLKGMTVGETYTVSVVAVRGEEKSKEGTIEVSITEEAQRTWAASRYGSSVNTSNNGYKGSALDGKVTVYSEGGKGKIVPGSTDGLTFYYTVIDPDTENFTLTANVHVDNWTLSNGQEGFGLMAADTVGKDGDGTAFWNNCYQLIASKIEYYHDGEAITTDTAANKISMKLGLGYTAKLGVTANDVAEIKKGTITMPEGFTTESGTLESSCAALGAGTYNIVGNYAGVEPTGCVDNLITDFVLQIQRNNTGYIMRYLDEAGNVIGEKLYYDLDRNELTKIDPEHIYLGFFASRNARITATNINLVTINPADDEAALEREIEYVYPSYTIESATVANAKDYDLVFYGNADGVLSIVDNNGNTITEGTHVLANTKNHFASELSLGTTTYTVTFTPDEDYVPGEFKKLTSYETAVFTHSVLFKNIGNLNNIYVAQNGKDSAVGTKENPVDIYTAVKYAQPGQTIILAGGVYNLSRTVKVERGINGTADAKIYMIADPEATERPVFDFGGACAGMILAGDYWYFKGFDVTRSADAQKGIQVSGNNNVLDQINTYKNGNTGIQISRYLGTDNFENWPANNLILNCTSYLNADKGYEDADGFAAKLTVGNGNVFDGCIAAYNADDGWDLFAKVQTGSIGSVTIQNCLTFRNGYVLKNAAGELDLNGTPVNAGNGNGFKMGGDSMSGYHVLKNSIAFENKAKGFDSNSCPDIQVYNSTAFNNESYNVAFYTNTAVNTDFLANGVLSFKNSNSVAENFKLLGTQDKNKVYGVSNFFFGGTASENTEGTKVAEDWFVSLDTTNALAILSNRNEDGSINMNGLLELTDKAPESVGARMSGTASADVIVEEDEARPADPVKPSNPSSGSGSSGANDVVDPGFTAPSATTLIENIANAIVPGAGDVLHAINNAVANTVSAIRNWITGNRRNQITVPAVIEDNQTPLAAGEAVDASSQAAFEVAHEAEAVVETVIEEEDTPLAAERNSAAGATAAGVAVLLLVVGSTILFKKKGIIR